MDPRNNPVFYFLRQIYTIQCTRLVFRAQQPNLVCFPSLIPVHLMPRLFHPMHSLFVSVSIFCAGAGPWALPARHSTRRKNPGVQDDASFAALSPRSTAETPKESDNAENTIRLALRLGATHCGTAVTHQPLEDAVHPRHHRRLAGWPGRGQLALLSFPSKRPAAVAGKVTSSSSPDGENHPCAPAICNSKQRFAGRAAFFADRRT